MKDRQIYNRTFQSKVDAELERTLAGDKMIYRSLYLVIATTIMFGAFGGIVGWLLSILTPDYYRSRFDALDSEVWQIAVGSGVTQGLIVGAAVGCVVLLATAWYRSRVKAGIVQQFQQPSDE